MVKKSKTYFIEEELIKLMDDEAKEEDRSVSYILNEILKNYYSGIDSKKEVKKR